MPYAAAFYSTKQETAVEQTQLAQQQDIYIARHYNFKHYTTFSCIFVF
jgi:hypothetical protein